MVVERAVNTTRISPWVKPDLCSPARTGWQRLL